MSASGRCAQKHILLSQVVPSGLRWTALSSAVTYDVELSVDAKRLTVINSEYRQCSALLTPYYGQ